MKHENGIGFQGYVSNYTQSSKDVLNDEAINVTIQQGVLTMPDGSQVDLKAIQAALNFGFQELGDPDLMAACDQMSIITGLEQGPSGEFVKSGVSNGNVRNVQGEVASLPFYVWASEDCGNKTNDFDDAKRIRKELIAAGHTDVYIADADGVEVVDAEIEAHELELNSSGVQGKVESAKASSAVSLSETTLTFSLPDDFGAGWEYVNERLYGASHAWAGSYDKSESANFAHEALMQVQGVVSSYLATGMTCNVSFVVNDIAEAAAIQSRLQAVVDAFESKPQRSISVRGSNFYDSSVTEYDANDPDVEIVSDMPFLNYLAKYVPMAEFLPALSGHDLAALRAEADEHQLAKQADKDDLPSPGM